MSTSSLSSKLRIDDIIRNKKPYWGEGIKKIISEDDLEYVVQIGPGKYGGWQAEQFNEVIFKDQGQHYRKATIWEIFWLFILGWIVDNFLGK